MMQFCGLTILSDKIFSQKIAEAKLAQRKMSAKLIAGLLWNAEQYRQVAEKEVGRPVKIRRR